MSDLDMTEPRSRYFRKIKNPYISYIPFKLDLHLPDVVRWARQNRIRHRFSNFVCLGSSRIYFLDTALHFLPLINVEELCTICPLQSRAALVPNFFLRPRFLTIQSPKSQSVSTGVSTAAIGRFARHANARMLDFKPTAHFARYLPNQDRFRQPVFAYHHLILQRRRMLVRIRLRRTPRSQHYRAMEVIHLNPKM